MRFFHLTHPRYETDQEANRRNPVTCAVSHRIPGITCEVCGPWSSSARLRVPLPSAADEFVGVSFLPVGEWMISRDRWARLLGIEPDRVEPGASLGTPTGTCTAQITEDVVHPIPGEVWVVARVRDALTAAGLTGVSFASVQLSPECTKADLSELVVHGQAWRRGSSAEGLRLCETCGRRACPSPKDLAVDETRWDGSDFLFLDANPSIVVISERAADVFNANTFTNVVLEPVR